LANLGPGFINLGISAAQLRLGGPQFRLGCVELGSGGIPLCPRGIIGRLRCVELAARRELACEERPMTFQIALGVGVLHLHPLDIGTLVGHLGTGIFDRDRNIYHIGLGILEIGTGVLRSHPPGRLWLEARLV
jgi:hypothetical protein